MLLLLKFVPFTLIICNYIYTRDDLFSAVEIVMSKKPVTLLDTTLDINPYAPLLQGDESINGVEIRGLPSGLTQDILSLQIEGVPDSHTVSKVDKAGMHQFSYNFGPSSSTMHTSGSVYLLSFTWDY